MRKAEWGKRKEEHIASFAGSASKFCVLSGPSETHTVEFPQNIFIQTSHIKHPSMAGFKTHITTSCLLGVGYTGTGIYLGLPIEASLVAGGLCGIGGMLPDIDSDSGIPFRESMGFAAAIVPVLMLDRLREFGLNHEQMVLITGSLYLFVRFGIARLLARYTVHRGMFHSLPAALIFAGITFLVSGCADLQLRYFKATGIFIGVMSHLMLDEIYAVEWTGGRWRFKKSFGTAMKLWGKSGIANVSTYAKLALVVLMILGEPMVMERYGIDLPLALQREQWIQHDDHHFAQADPRGIAPPHDGNHRDGNVAPQAWNAPENQQAAHQNQPQRDRTVYDTWRRISQRWRGEPAQR